MKMRYVVAAAVQMVAVSTEAVPAEAVPTEAWGVPVVAWTLAVLAVGWDGFQPHTRCQCGSMRA